MKEAATMEPVLIVLQASASCRAAEKHLRSVGISFRVIDAEEAGILTSLKRDLDIDNLPALLTPERVYVGVDEIRASFRSGRP